ncbi:hypothetical protein [Variovorax sp. GB1P17]|uniref:hypothetical protein n=1 Tax=Variovorax sp. GB1P17 TaxID=3443740 RepID=UPI003F46E012
MNSRDDDSNKTICFALSGEQDTLHANTLEKQQAENHAAGRQLFYRNVSWEILADKITLNFRAVREHANRVGWFEWMYISRIDARRTIQLFCGQHPVGNTKGERSLESGCTLVMSQGPLGSVIVLFYPFESEVVRRKKSRIIWGHFDGPEEIADHVLARMLKDFLIYERVSSALFVESANDRKRVEKLEDRSRAIEGDETGGGLSRTVVGLLATGSVAVAVLLVWWMIDGLQGGSKSAFLEPIVGLLTLVVGWAAARAQKYKDAIAKAQAREEAERAMKEGNAAIEKQRLSRQ